MENDKKSVLDSYLSSHNPEANSDVRVLSVEPAGNMARIVALFLDGILFGAVSFAITYFLKLPEGTQFLVQFLGAGFFISRYGATPGKMAMDLEVIELDGSRPGFVKGGFRDSVGHLISFATLCIGYVMGLVRADRRTLHDLIFKTRVINAR